MSLPGIVAAKCGAEVTLSDSSELPHCLEICRQSCQMNNLPQVHVVGLTWGHVSRDLLALPPQDIILASDVFFEPEGKPFFLLSIQFNQRYNGIKSIKKSFLPRLWRHSNYSLLFDAEEPQSQTVVYLPGKKVSWCTGKTQRGGVEREAGGGIGMGSTCKSMADSCQCMAETTTIMESN